MLYDLNVVWTPSTTRDDLDRLLAFSSELGYDVVALNHVVTAPLPAHPTNPITVLTRNPSITSTPSSTPPRILRRGTVILSDPSTSLRLSAIAPLYDLLAVRPTTAAAFQSACVSLPDLSIISLDLASHLGFPIRPRPAMAAVARGVRFEICYAQMTAASAHGDARARSNFICNAGNLVRATQGRGIIVSSGVNASSPGGLLSLRAPADVVNLLAVWDLSQERGRASLGVVPRGVVVNEGLRRSGFRGVVDIVQTADVDKRDSNYNKEAKNANKDANKQKQKRKTPGDGDGDDDTGQDQPPPGLSKRQAKKLKLAASRALPES